MQPVLDMLFDEESELALYKADKVTEGFIDQKGNFLTREAARIIADREYQTERPLSPMSDIIFSEDLYQDDLRIVCAANKFPSGLIVCSARHHDPVMNAQIRALHQRGFYERAGMSGQGFLTSKGEWVDRTEALRIADAAYQINTRRSKGGLSYHLYSEDLY